jgi:hypothetical protein
MERMDMHSRNEYLKVLRGRYLKAKTRKEKSRILDESFYEGPVRRGSMSSGRYSLG